MGTLHPFDPKRPTRTVRTPSIDLDEQCEFRIGQHFYHSGTEPDRQSQPRFFERCGRRFDKFITGYRCWLTG